MPRPKLPRYDTEAHAARVREVLVARIARLPLPALIRLQEVAALLEAGEDLSVLAARADVGVTRGHSQAQRRESVDAGQRSGAAVNVGRRAVEEADRAAVVVAAEALTARFRRRPS